MYSSTLTLSDVRMEDEGMYTCILRGLDSNGQSITANQSITLTGVSGKNYKNTVEPPITDPPNSGTPPNNGPPWMYRPLFP